MGVHVHFWGENADAAFSFAFKSRHCILKGGSVRGPGLFTSDYVPEITCTGSALKGVDKVLTNVIKVALGQVRPVLGDVQHNIEKHLEWVETARQNQADLIVFPELGLTGYQVQDLTLEVARRATDPDISRVVSASRGLDIVFSFVEESDDHRFYVSAIYASDGEIRHLHRKVYLPTYGMFDEGRYFAAGHSFRSFTSRFDCTGLLVCEDAWHLSSPYLLGLDGANLLLLPASSPSRSVTDQEQFGSQLFWHQLMSVYARLLGMNIVFVNRVGFEDGVNFFGGSFIVSAEGEFLVEAPKLEETIIYGHLDLTSSRRARYATPILRDEKLDVVARELQRIGQRER